VGISDRKVREKEQLRAAILEAASELFLVNGIAEVSMRMIAEKIEYSPTTIYLYFRDKADLVRAVVSQYFVDFHRRIEALRRESSDDPLGTLRAGMREYIDFGLAHPMAYRLAFMAENPQGPPPEGEDVGRRAYGQLLAMVSFCIDQGVFRDGPPEVVTNVIWSMNHGITSLLITVPQILGPDRDTLIGASIQAAIDAFRSG
jgi:AcrR family transcriptional regulator